MGWLTLVAVLCAAILGLIALGVRRPLWSLAGAALMLGATGYALQGRPALPSQPARPATAMAGDDPSLLALRDQMLGRNCAECAYMIAADAMQRAGEKRAAVQAVLGGLRRYRQSVLLWVGLGNVLAAHDGNRLSPPALFAFQQAARLAPEHPAPPFWLGIAHIRAGDFAAARPLWARALALTPEQVSFRPQIAQRLAVLDAYLAEVERGRPVE
jgi:cytochrome c-type biogenesis protein CcmH/NrfG